MEIPPGQYYKKAGHKTQNNAFSLLVFKSDRGACSRGGGSISDTPTYARID